MKQNEVHEELPQDVQDIFEELNERISPYDYIHYGLKLLGDTCFEMAKARTSYFHRCREEEHNYRRERDWGFLICRAYKNTGSNGISIDWLEQKPIPKRSRKPGAASNVLSSRIPKGKGTSYSRRVVITKKRKDYETELFDELEPQFAPIRHLSDLLAKAVRSVHDAKTAHNKVLGDPDN